MSRMLIIGGSDVGISSALRIRELNSKVDVTVIVADAYLGFSICGLPFYLSGEVTDWQTLAHHKTQEFEEQGIRLLLNQRAETILPTEKVGALAGVLPGIVQKISQQYFKKSFITTF